MPLPAFAAAGIRSPDAMEDCKAMRLQFIDDNALEQSDFASVSLNSVPPLQV
jgi:hypothetical protein